MSEGTSPPPPAMAPATAGPPPCPVRHADVTKGSMEIANRLKDIRCLNMDTGEMKRIGDYWEEDAEVESAGGGGKTKTENETGGGGVSTNSSSSNTSSGVVSGGSVDISGDGCGGCFGGAYPAELAAASHTTPDAISATGVGSGAEARLPNGSFSPTTPLKQQQQPSDQKQNKNGRGPVIFIFLRRWGCALCRMNAANWNLLKPVFDRFGIRMVGVGVERTGYEEFRAGGYFDGELLVDEKKDCYTALGCGANTWRSFWGLFDGEIPRLIRKSREKGFENTFQGDTNQLGGTFIFDASNNGSLLFGHYQTSHAFEPSMSAIFGVLGLQAPEGYDPHAAEDPSKKKKRKSTSGEEEQPKTQQ